MGCFLIACSTPGEAELTTLAQELSALGLNCFVFHEPDLNGQATALASLVPHSARKFFNRLPLWRHP